MREATEDQIKEMDRDQLIKFAEDNYELLDEFEKQLLESLKNNS